MAQEFTNHSGESIVGRRMMVYIIYMAAGNSKRFGTDKLLHKESDKYLFEYGLCVALNVKKQRKEVDIIVVTRADEIKKRAESMGIKAVISPESEYGVSFTIKKAITEIDGLKEDDYLCFMVADQPFIKTSSLLKLIDAAKSRPQIVRMRYGNRHGNPIMFSARLKDELLELKGDEGGRKLTLCHKCVFVDVDDENELIDIDTTEDAKKNNGKFNF